MNLFLSVGAMKAGTTWLYSMLEKHPDLYFTPEKEIHFLNHYYVNNNVLRDEYRLNQAKNRLKPENTNHIGVYKKLARWYAMYLENPKDFVWYERLFSLNKQKKYNCDFSNLSAHLDVNHWSDLKKKFPNVKLIYILRDPVSRLWSHTKFHHQFAGKGTDFIQWNEIDFKFFLSKKFIWENATYAKYIKNIRAVFPEEDFKVFYFEDFTANPKDKLFELEEFLGISHANYDENRLFQKVNTSKSLDMPDSFLRVSKKLVQKEIEEMQRMNLRIPESWSGSL